jgi:AcrR family transcriptional regulator
MAVNGDIGHGGGAERGRRRQAERSAATRRALLDSGRALFAARGFAGTAREDIVSQAGVTRGALYHHFVGKEQLFRAVYEEMEREIADRILTAAATGPDPAEQLRLGCRAFLDLATDPAVQRIALIDAPSVLGWRTWREVEAVHGLGLVRDGLQAAMDAGQIRPQPVTPLSHVVLAALNEAALYIAGAADPVAARVEMGAVLDGLLARL